MQARSNIGTLVFSSATGAVAMLFNSMCVLIALQAGMLSPRDQFTWAFVSITLAFVTALPILGKKLDTLPEDLLRNKLGLPKGDEGLSFDAILAFLKEQRAGAFAAVLMICAGKYALGAFGPFVSGAIVSLCFIACMGFVMISVMKFTMRFTSQGFFACAAAALLAAAAASLALDYGLKHFS